jgi:hypothetical protein
MEACYGGTDVMERSCAVARGIDINNCPLCRITGFTNANAAVRCMHVSDLDYVSTPLYQTYVYL